MTNTEIIYSALLNSDIDVPEIELVETEGNCMVCGKAIAAGAPYKKVLSGSFTDWDICKNLATTHICKECGTVIKTKELRTNSFIACEGILYLLKKNDIEKHLFNLGEYVTGEFVVGLTRSFKKHSSFKCPINRSINEFYIQEEDKTYVFEAEKLKPLYKKLWEAYLYFTKDELLTGNYKLMSLMEFGVNRFNDYEQVFKKHRGSHYYDLLVYLMNSGRRNEIVEARIKEQKKIKEAEKKAQKELERKEKAAQMKVEQEIPGQISLF